MKIPETSANVGAYYGNEENGQWQPNGVIIDTGVGGGVVGSGDAGVDRPMYPVHLPPAHITGYVMAGTYYGNAGGAGAAGYAPPPDDFADYMWMEHEDEFDKQVMQQLEEEALMEQCIEAMLEDEQRERARPHNAHAHSRTPSTTSNGTSLSLQETVSRSKLNPLAAEFVPTRRPPEEKPEAPSEPVPEPAKEESKPVDVHTETTHTTAEETQPEPEPPCVSAADTTDSRDRDGKRLDRDSRKPEAKKPLRQESKKVSKSPQVAKSETKVTPKKKEVKAVKSEVKVTENVAPAPAPAPLLTPDDLPPLPTKTTQPTPVEEPSGPKPINYAAAAKANKKKATPPPNTEKTPPPAEKPKPKTEKVVAKTEKVTAAKPVQRKNSTK